MHVVCDKTWLLKIRKLRCHQPVIAFQTLLDSFGVRVTTRINANKTGDVAGSLVWEFADYHGTYPKAVYEGYVRLPKIKAASLQLLVIGVKN
jgi:hypothetical protein